MEAESSMTRRKDSNSKLPSSSSKRLLFDNRYGWIIDEWKEPREEALTGGRGMFCIVPVASALLHTASQSINLIGSSTVKVLQRPDLLSPQMLQANLNDQLKKFISSIQKADLHLLALKSCQPTSFPSDIGTESNGLKTS
ncbi:uncharacterized protein LOC127806494 [Diospyros lotus]|uniref:uncharacterized protein LOC127806494 n=1 Tax=Diospyros lotus TaxID=55363 RepID=UPI002253A833|nr:uncharacterized protein LOC127806494 [Diospyros lotus]